MRQKMKVLIVDDEILARELMKNYLAGMGTVEVVGESANGLEAIKAVHELKPDVMILDIQMPKVDGFELLEVLEERPQIIFATAFDQYAIKAFEANAVDYLLKPFSRERLLQALEKTAERIAAGSKLKDIASDEEPLKSLRAHLDHEARMLERVVTRLGTKITVIPADKIWYLEAQDDYVMIWSELGNHLKEKTMKYFEAHLPAGQFIRVHRSFIVNISQVRSIEAYTKDTYIALMKSGAKVKVSPEGYKRVKNLLA